MGNEKTDWMIYSDREMSVMSAQEEKVSFKELIKSLGMTQKEFSETFGIPMGTLRHWISGDRECPVYTKRMLAYMVELKRLETRDTGCRNNIPGSAGTKQDRVHYGQSFVYRSLHYAYTDVQGRK